MRPKTVSCLFVVLMIVLIAPSLFLQGQATSRPAGKRSVDPGAFLKEIMAVQLDGEVTSLAMWLPYEFIVAGDVAQGKDQAAVEKDAAFLKPYLLFVVQVSKDQEDGTSVYSTDGEVRNRMLLRLADGTELRPIAKAPPMVLATVSAMKSLMAAEGDAGGKNMHVVIFSGRNPQGKPLVNTSAKDKITLVLKAAKGFKETAFSWRTPFDATASVSPCATCKGELSAKWTFCPWCGHPIAPGTTTRPR